MGRGLRRPVIGRLLLSLGLAACWAQSAADDWGARSRELVAAARRLGGALAGPPSLPPVAVPAGWRGSACPYDDPEFDYNRRQSAEAALVPVLDHLLAANRIQRELCVAVTDKFEESGRFLAPNRIEITVGALGEVQSESQLAGLLAHEIGHFLLSDRAWRSLSVKAEELDADLLATRLLSRAGYPPFSAAGGLLAVVGPEAWTSRHYPTPTESVRQIVGELAWTPAPAAAPPPPRVLPLLEALGLRPPAAPGR